VYIVFQGLGRGLGGGLGGEGTVTFVGDPTPGECGLGIIPEESCFKRLLPNRCPLELSSVVCC